MKGGFMSPRACFVAALTILALLPWATVRAQGSDAPKVLSACYQPSVGLVYRIREPGLPARCLGPHHVEFSWNAAGPKGDKGDKGDPGNLALAGRICPAGLFVTGFDASGGLICAGNPGANIETCNGVDDDQDGQTDEGLAYCFNGTPAPHTNGATCSPGFEDQDGDPVNGCETSLAGTNFSGTWLTERLVYTCGQSGVSFVSIDFSGFLVAHSGTSITFTPDGGTQPGTMVGSISPDGSFSAEAVITGEVTETYRIVGLFTGTNSFSAQFNAQFSGVVGDCTNQTMSLHGVRS